MAVRFLAVKSPLCLTKNLLGDQLHLALWRWHVDHASQTKEDPKKKKKRKEYFTLPCISEYVNITRLKGSHSRWSTLCQCSKLLPFLILWTSITNLTREVDIENHVYNIFTNHYNKYLPRYTKGKAGWGFVALCVTHCKSSIQDIVDEMAPIKISPPTGLRADSFVCDVTRLIWGL